MLNETRKGWAMPACCVLLLILAAELIFSIRQHSQTFDESAHLYAGLSYWARSDFGVNPEHPPLVKLVAALPLLGLRGEVAPAPNIFFRGASSVGGGRFLYSHNADDLLFRARLAAGVFTLMLAALIFFAGREMYGAGAGLFGLALFVFEPNILAHGALVTTDMGAACCIFGAVYLFYRYIKRPSVLRLVACGVVAGLALAAKHSALVILPILAVLAVTEVVLMRPEAERWKGWRSSALRMAGSLAAIGLLSVAVLWTFYGFRYAARPNNQAMVPPTAVFLEGLKHPKEAAVIGFLERHHVLPEAYLYGLTDIAIGMQEGRPAYLFGKLYPQGRWFYFPSAFLVKSTLGFLALLALLLAARSIWGLELRRGTLFIAVPVFLFFTTAMISKLDIGLRHILPVFPFLIVLAAAGASALSARSRVWAGVAVILLLFHSGSSLMAFPNYLPYSNEVWGGVPDTHKVLADSNVGWAGGLKSLASYIRTERVGQCWFAYDGPAELSYYGIRCSPLPTFFSNLLGRPQPATPEQIEGPVFIGSQVLTGFDWGPEQMNPYRNFVVTRPTKVLEGEILVYNGTFHVPEIAALSHFILASRLAGAQPDRALAEARISEALNPNFRGVHELLASLYVRQQQPEPAKQEYEAALNIYRTIHPEFQKLRALSPNPVK